MAKSAFIDPTATLRKEFMIGEDTYWVDIKAELSFGEEQALAGALMGALNSKQFQGKGKADSADIALSMEFRKAALEKIALWAVGWSLTNAKGAEVAITREAIASLRPPVAEAINEIIDAQAEANEAMGKPPTGQESTD